MPEPTPIRLNPVRILALWREALSHEIGIAIAVPTGLEKIRTWFYQVRKAAAEPALAELQLLTAPGLTEIWIVRKSVEAP